MGPRYRCFKSTLREQPVSQDRRKRGALKPAHVPTKLMLCVSLWQSGTSSPALIGEQLKECAVFREALPSPVWTTREVLRFGPPRPQAKPLSRLGLC